jgi:hypothetical protein
MLILLLYSWVVFENRGVGTEAEWGPHEVGWHKSHVAAAVYHLWCILKLLQASFNP